MPELYRLLRVLFSGGHYLARKRVLRLISRRSLLQCPRSARFPGKRPHSRGAQAAAAPAPVHARVWRGSGRAGTTDAARRCPTRREAGSSLPRRGAGRAPCAPFCHLPRCPEKVPWRFAQRSPGASAVGNGVQSGSRAKRRVPRSASARMRATRLARFPRRLRRGRASHLASPCLRPCGMACSSLSLRLPTPHKFCTPSARPSGKTRTQDRWNTRNQLHRGHRQSQGQHHGSTPCIGLTPSLPVDQVATL
jgi:hypothetical protein